MNADHKSLEIVFDCHFVASRATNDNHKLCFYDLRSTFVDSINVFDCHLSEVFIEYRPTEYEAKTNNPKQGLLGIFYSRVTNGNKKTLL